MLSQELIDAIIAALAMVADGVGEGLVALSVGFAAMPTAIGLAIAAVLIFLFSTVTPVGFQVESLIVASQKAKKSIQLFHIVILAGVVGAILGAFGLFGIISDFIGDAVLSGMLAGVGILLALAAIDMTKRGKEVGIVSIAVAVLVYLIMQDLVYSLAASVVAGAIVARFVKTEPIDVNMKREKIELISSVKKGFGNFLKQFTKKEVMWGAAALLALRIGTSIAFSNIDADLAGGVDPKSDQVNIIAGIAGAASGLFGGAPVEPLISGTAAAPMPEMSAVIFVALMAVVCFFLLLPKLAKILPEQVIAGFLFVIGALVAFPENMSLALEAGSIVGGVTAVTTGITDPFTGMVVGVIFKYMFEWGLGGPAMAMLGITGSAIWYRKPKNKELVNRLKEKLFLRLKR